MNLNLRRAFSVVVAFIFVGALLQPFAREAAGRPSGGNSLQGTWRVQVNPKNCQTGAPLPSFDVLLSFAQGGTLIEAINSPAFLPGQRTTGLGVWSHSHGNSYKAIWEAFILFDSSTMPGFKRGVQRLTWDFTVDGDQATIEATSQFLDSTGNVLGNTCASGAATRFGEAEGQN